MPIPAPSPLTSLWLLAYGWLIPRKPTQALGALAGSAASGGIAFLSHEKQALPHPSGPCSLVSLLTVNPQQLQIITFSCSGSNTVFRVLVFRDYIKDIFNCVQMLDCTFLKDRNHNLLPQTQDFAQCPVLTKGMRLKDETSNRDHQSISGSSPLLSTGFLHSCSSLPEILHRGKELEEAMKKRTMTTQYNQCIEKRRSQSFS